MDNYCDRSSADEEWPIGKCSAKAWFFGIYTYVWSHHSMPDCIAMQNISRITAEMSRSPASISSINSVCYHDNKAWRLLLANTDLFFPKHSSVFPVSAFATRGGGHQIHPWHNSWEVSRATPQIHLSSSWCSQDVNKWDDWHDRWKIRNISDLTFILEGAAVWKLLCLWLSWLGRMMLPCHIC